MTRRKFFLLALIVLVIVFILCIFFIEPEYQGEVSLRKDKILIFAHRGFGNHAPDNSLAGAQMALEAGVDGVDVDAQQTKDKRVVIFHDVSLERFTTGEGRVDGYTFNELRQFDLGLKYGNGTEFSNAFIESFENFVKEITPSSLLMVELKVATARNTGIEENVVNILSEYDAFDKAYVSSFNPIVLYRLKKIDSRVQTVFIFQDSNWNPERIAETKTEDRVSLPWYLQTEWTRRIIRKVVKPDALSINEKVSEETIDLLIKKGWPVFLWSLNTLESLEWGVEKKPYGIVTDEPLLTKRFYGEYFDN